MIECFVINLKKDTKRLDSIKSQFKKYSDIVNLNIVEAIDGSSNEISIIKEKLRHESLKRAWLMSNGEIACFLSHQKTLKYFLNKNIKCALICEDDIIIHQKLWDNIVKIVNFCSLQEKIFCNLSVPSKDHSLPVKSKKYGYFEIKKEIDLVQYVKNRFGTTCYCLTRNVAQILCNKEPIAPYDSITKHLCFDNVKHVSTKYEAVNNLFKHSSINACYDPDGGRMNTKKVTKKSLGILRYYYYKKRLSCKYFIFMQLFNIREYGLFATILAWIKK